MIPDSWNESATRYVPYAATTEIATSSCGSSVACIARKATIPATSPIAVLTATVTTNETTPPASETGAERAAIAIVNSTTPVPSLSRLSASTSVASRFGAPTRLNSDTTATGSVAEMIAPSTNASGVSRSVKSGTTTATTTAVIRTPGAASTATTPKVRRSSVASIL